MQVLEDLIQEGKVLPMKLKKDGVYKQVFYNEVGEERGGKAVASGLFPIFKGRRK